MGVVTSILKVLGALIGAAILFAIIFGASVEAPLIALLAAAAGSLVAYQLWTRRPSLTRRIIAIITGLFVAGVVAGYIRHYDGSVAAAERAKADEAKAKAAAEVAEKQRLAREKEAAEAAARLEQQKRDEAEMAALRKTDPDQYLARLKEKDGVKWLEELKSLRPRLYAAHVEQEKKEAAQRAAEIEDRLQRSHPLDYLTLDMTWQKGGFNTVMLATFTVKSTLKYPVRDLRIRCIMSANSGTELSKIDHVIYDIVPPRSTKRFPGVNMGFIPNQASQASCVLRGVER